MKSWESVLIPPDMSLREAIQKIDSATTKVALIVDENRKLLGMLADGDIRRALLQGVSLNDAVDSCMHREPRTASVTESRESILSIMRQRGINQIPIVDDEGRVLGLKLLKNYLNPEKRENWVVIMAGGLGSRLKELTKNTPKPMLHVGSRPLLETIVKRFVEQGFYNIWLAVNYQGEKIEEYFGDGAKFSANIKYLREDKRLGTAGALSLLPENPTLPILITNADLLATVDYGEMLDAHIASEASATMAIREYEYQIPYGVIETGTDEKIQALKEKPIHKALVNAGMYVISPEALEYVPDDHFVDMPELFSEFVSAGLTAICHRVHGYWLDIGRHEDFYQANADFTEIFK